MADSLKAFENSLRDFLIDEMADATNTPQALAYQFNNLKVYIDPRKTPEAHFYVSVRLSEVCYDIENLKKINGSLGYIERYVVKWAEKPNINGELKKIWVLLSKSNSGGLLNKSAESEALEEKLRIANLNSQTISLLGTGKSRFKRFERLRKRRGQLNGKNTK